MWLITKDGIKEILSEKKTNKAKEIWEKIAPNTNVKELTLPFVEEIKDETQTEIVSEDGFKIFSNTEFGKIRTIEKDGEPLFCLVDVARALKYANSANAVTKYCKGVTVLMTPTSGGSQNIKYGTESEVYRLVLKSKAPNAEKFQDWICEEVLPSIRKTGGYIATTPDMTDAEIMSRAIVIAQNTIAQQGEKLKALQVQFDSIKKENTQLQVANAALTSNIAENAPKVAFANAVEQGNAISIKELAGILRQNGVKIGQNRLFEWLRDNRYLCSRNGIKNYPTQRALDMELFTVVEYAVKIPNGDVINTFSTKVTGKGQTYFVEVFTNKF